MPCAVRPADKFCLARLLKLPTAGLQSLKHPPQMLPTAIVILLSVSPSPVCCGPRTCTHVTINQPLVSFDSANFQVRSNALGCDARSVAQCCESWRQYLSAQWLEDEHASGWNPRCTVIVHARRDAYRVAVGRGGEQSFGSSWIDFQSGRITARRIDLLVDSRGVISALGHEMTHLVVADAFPGVQPPIWANEGLALLADSSEKQRLHQRDLEQSLRLRAGYHSAELFQMANYPQPERLAAFYAQSASVTAFLVKLGGTKEFLPFLKRSSDVGYDQALADFYDIDDVAELHRRWHAETVRSQVTGLDR